MLLLIYDSHLYKRYRGTANTVPRPHSLILFQPNNTFHDFVKLFAGQVIRFHPIAYTLVFKINIEEIIIIRRSVLRR